MTYCGAFFCPQFCVMATVRGRPSGLPGFAPTSGFPAHAQLPPIRLETESGSSIISIRSFPMIKETPNPRKPTTFPPTNPPIPTNSTKPPSAPSIPLPSIADIKATPRFHAPAPCFPCGPRARLPKPWWFFLVEIPGLGPIVMVHHFVDHLEGWVAAMPLLGIQTASWWRNSPRTGCWITSTSPNPAATPLILPCGSEFARDDGQHIQYLRRLTHRHREQTRSYKGTVCRLLIDWSAVRPPSLKAAPTQASARS